MNFLNLSDSELALLDELITEEYGRLLEDMSDETLRQRAAQLEAIHSRIPGTRYESLPQAFGVED